MNPGRKTKRIAHHDKLFISICCARHLTKFVGESRVTLRNTSYQHLYFSADDHILVQHALRRDPALDGRACHG
jgi:hypothetical protein